MKLIDVDQAVRALETKAREASEKLWPKEFIDGLRIAQKVVEGCPAIREEMEAEPSGEEITEQMRQMGEIIGSRYTRADCGAAIMLASETNLGSIMSGDTSVLAALGIKLITDTMMEVDANEYKIRMYMERITESVVQRVMERSKEGDSGNVGEM